MTVFRMVTLNSQDEDGDEFAEILIVPDSTSTDQLMLDPESAEVVCECFSEEWAVHIVDLLNKFSARMEMH